MNKFHFTCIMFAVNAGLLSCYTGPEEPHSHPLEVASVFDKPKAEAFIDSVNKKFTAYVRNGDSVSLAAFYHSDAQLLFANSEPITGKQILHAWGDIIRMGVKEFTFNTTDITGSGDLLVETGNYEMKTAENAYIDKGKYVVIWKMENGQWKLYRDIGNTSLPATK